MFPKFLISLAMYSVMVGVVGDMVTKVVPDPYMDEIFHIPQAQRYCDGNFTAWDPKITTLPGLYLFSVGLLEPAHKLSSALGLEISKEQLCSTANLRSINLVMAIINAVLLHTLTSHIHGMKENYSEVLGIWSSCNISLLPVLFMFTFMYYTDPVSTAMVLLTYCLHLSGQDWLAAFAGFLSVLCRQTNIVWVFLAAAETAGELVTSEVRLHQARTKHPPTLSLTMGGQLWELGMGLVDLARYPWRILRILGLVVVSCGGYLLVGVAFLGFVHLNQGIVVGDRSAHTATVHLLQLGYFAAFFTGLTLPFAVKNLRDFFAFVKNNYGKLIIVVMVMAMAIQFNTMAHPYLLADNRHYTFYIWRKVFMRHWLIKFLLIPVYIFGFFHICKCLVKSDLVFKLVLPFCVVLSLVPQLLLEFRYFILPFILIRAQIKPTCWKSLAIETAMMVGVNVATLYLFLYKPFHWEQEPESLQRFMW